MKYITSCLSFMKKPLNETYIQTITIIFIVLHSAGVLTLLFTTQLAEWQTGKFGTYLQVFLSKDVFPLYYPFLALSVGSAIAYVFSLKQFKKNHIVTVGIYSGTFIATVLTILFFMSSIQFLMFVVGSIIIAAIFVAVKVIDEFFTHRTFKKIVLLNCISYGLIVGILSLITDGSAAFGLLILSPFLISISGILLSLHVIQQNLPYTKSEHIRNWSIYGILFSGTTVAAIYRTFEMYSRLPKEPPQCYIATAAARGHRSLTGSIDQFDANTRQSYVMNDQLVILKSGELIIKTLFPSIHKVFRTYYNNYGQRIARKIHNPFLADAVYISLIPATLIVKSLLFFIFPNYTQFVKK